MDQLSIIADELQEYFQELTPKGFYTAIDIGAKYKGVALILPAFPILACHTTLYIPYSGDKKRLYKNAADALTAINALDRFAYELKTNPVL